MQKSALKIKPKLPKDGQIISGSSRPLSAKSPSAGASPIGKNENNRPE